MNDYRDFSSMPAETEQQFVPFEQHTRRSAKAAVVVGVSVAVGALVVILAVVFSFESSENQHAKDLLQDEKALTTDTLGVEGRAPTPEAPATTTTDAPEATGTDAPEATDAEAPPAGDEADPAGAEGE